MRPPTIEEYRRLNLTRPYTDLLDGGGIGAGSHAKRSADADHSRIISDHLGHDDLVPGTNPPDTSSQAPRRTPAAHHGEHGTRSGYQAHIRLKETPCRACKAANATYHRSRKGAA